MKTSTLVTATRNKVRTECETREDLRGGHCFLFSKSKIDQKIQHCTLLDLSTAVKLFYMTCLMAAEGTG